MTLLRAAAGCLLLVLLAIGGTGCEWPGRGAVADEDDPDFRAGIKHKRAGRPTLAAEAFERARQRNPQSAMVHFELGLLYYTEITNYVAALYHFDRVKQLQADFRYIQAVDQMMRACKQEFVREVPLGIITEQMRRDLQRLERLEQENKELRGQLARMEADMTTQRREATRQQERAPREDRPTEGTLRTYQVRKGDTMYGIARVHEVPPNALLAANPRVDPHRIVPGQILRIPTQ